MPTRLFRVATLSAALLLTPCLGRSVMAADEPRNPKADTPPRPGAGGPDGRRMDPAALLERVESALNDLKLSEEQKIKARELLDKVHKSVDGAKEGAGREQIGKAIADLREGLTGLLNEEQKKELAEKAPFLSGGGGPRGGGPGGPGNGFQRGALQKAQQAAMEKVGLSDEQKTKVKSLGEEFEKKTRAIVEEGKGDRAAIQEKIRPLMEERRTKMAEILTPEQMTKFQEAMREELAKLRNEAGGPNARRPGGDQPGAPKPDGANQEKKTEEKKTEEKK